MKEPKVIQFEAKTHTENLLLAELNAIITTIEVVNDGGLYWKRPKEMEALTKAAKNVEDSLHLLITHREYIENPEEYQIKRS